MVLVSIYSILSSLCTRATEQLSIHFFPLSYVTTWFSVIIDIDLVENYQNWSKRPFLTTTLWGLLSLFSPIILIYDLKKYNFSKLAVLSVGLQVLITSEKLTKIPPNLANEWWGRSQWTRIPSFVQTMAL